MSKRIEWIDHARGIGILLMVIGHAGNIPNVKLWIYSFHMPLFFILTGYICALSWKSKFSGISGLTKLLLRNTKAYLVPYCILFSVNLVLQIAMDFLKGIRDEGLTDNILRYCLSGFLYSYDTDLPNCSPLWFLTCLYTAYILFWLMMQCENYKLIIVAAMGITLKFILKYEYNLNIDELFWHVDVAIVAAIFMLIGFYFPAFQKWIDDKKSIRTIVLLTLFVMGSFIGVVNGRINMVKNEYQNLIFFFLSAVFISTVIIEICRFTMCRFYPLIKKVFAFWGQNTLIFMGFNYFINTMVRVVFGYLHLQDTVIYSVFDVIFVMILCSAITFLWNRAKRKCLSAKML